MGCSALQLAWREFVRALKKVAHESGVSVEGVSQAYLAPDYRGMRSERRARCDDRSKRKANKCQQNRTPSPE